MEIIVSESNRLSKILEEFLRFVRPQERRVARLRRRGQHPGGPGPLPPVRRGLRRAHDRGRRRPPGSSLLSGDRDQIRQIVYNVAKNAVRAMPDGGTLTVEGREDGGLV